MIRAAIAALAPALAVTLPAAAQTVPDDALATLAAELNTEGETVRTTFAAIGCRLTVGFEERIRDDLVFATLARRNADQLIVADAQSEELDGETRVGIPLQAPMPLVITARGGDEDDAAQFEDSFGGTCAPTGCEATVEIAFFPVAVRGDDHPDRAEAVIDAMASVAGACRAEPSQ